ncbi:MAG: phasin family protein [Desulfobulbaceae bacterium]|nr:phasin family protein [Desulfobulbaceae bacterium]
MKDLIRDIFYLGAGAAFMTREKIEELRKELIERGKMTQEEGKQFVDDLMKKSEDVKQEMEKKVQDTVAEQMRKMNVATRNEIEELRAEIEILKAAGRKPKTKAE